MSYYGIWDENECKNCGNWRKNICKNCKNKKCNCSDEELDWICKGCHSEKKKDKNLELILLISKLVAKFIAG